MTKDRTWQCHGAMAAQSQFSAPSKMPSNPRKYATGKIRTRWSNKNHRFNPIKTNRFNTIRAEASNKIDIVKPTLRKVCNGFGPSYSYCKHGVQHPSPRGSGWSSKDWDGDKAKLGNRVNLWLTLVTQWRRADGIRRKTSKGGKKLWNVW